MGVGEIEQRALWWRKRKSAERRNMTSDLRNGHTLLSADPPFPHDWELGRPKLNSHSVCFLPEKLSV